MMAVVAANSIMVIDITVARTSVTTKLVMIK